MSDFWAKDRFEVSPRLRVSLWSSPRHGIDLSSSEEGTSVRITLKSIPELERLVAALQWSLERMKHDERNGEWGCVEDMHPPEWYDRVIAEAKEIDKKFADVVA